MNTDLFTLLVLGTGIAAALVAGIFYAFSTFIMGALAKIEPAKGIAAMQSINIVVINPWAMGAFFGTALAAILIGGWSLMGATSPLVLGGGLLYLIGTIGVTVVCNVPMNNALERLPADDAGSVEYWTHYCRRWTFWNSVRTVAALGASGMLIAAGF